MNKEIDDVIPFLVRVLNDIYSNVKEISKLMSEMNTIIDNFSKNMTDSIVSVSGNLTGIIKIVKTNREIIFNKMKNNIEDLNNKFSEFKTKMMDTTGSSKMIFEHLEKSKINLQNKMQDAEFLSLVLELKEILRKIEAQID